MKNQNENIFWAKKASEIFLELETRARGLDKEEARRRFLKFGANKLPEARVENWAVIFLRQFQSPLIYILLAAAAIVFATGQKTDGIIIMVVLLFNAIVGSVQEGRAQNIFLALKKLVATNASVIREGKEYIIPSDGIVPGDVIAIREGEKVPADARLIEAEFLKTDEAALTGESNPKNKVSFAIKKEKTSISEQSNMLFKGTNVVSGSGKAVVVATGEDTVIGKITQEAIGIDENNLPLKKSIKGLSRFIILAVIGIGLFIYITGLLFGHPIREIAAVIVSIAVSVIPEGLPIVVTLILARGAFRMGKKNVLIKKMQAVEALGQISFLAVDKTGTVTKNQLAVKNLYTDGKLFEIKGIGYEPKGEVMLKGKVIEPLNHPELLIAGKISALSSSAHLAYDEANKVWQISGDPTEASMLVLAEKIGFQRNDFANEIKKIDEEPFDYKKKIHSVLLSENENKFLAVSGAPETILSKSKEIWHSKGKTQDLSPVEKKKIEGIFLQMSKNGLRVVALAIRNNSNSIGDVSKLTFLALLGIEDKPRMEIHDAVNAVRLAGIKLAMITGDNENTARSVAEEAGIYKNKDIVFNGEEIEKLNEEELSRRISGTSIFARVNPIDKLKIINALKLNGETVAMTGDGVNDALSLASADVGVAMGKIGTEVAKEASDIILLDDNFGSIVAGVEEGKNIYKTIKRVILYLFSTSLGEILTIIGAILLGFPLPILAAQILWLNLVTDGFLDVALAMEPNRQKLTSFSRKRKKNGLIDKVMIARMFYMSLPMAIGTLFLFSYYWESNLVKAWTISLTTLAVFQWFNAWNCRSKSVSIFNHYIFSNIYLLLATLIVAGLQILAVYNPFMQKILRTVPLEGKDWLIILAVSSSVIILEEARKFIFRKFYKK